MKRVAYLGFLLSLLCQLALGFLPCLYPRHGLVKRKLSLSLAASNATVSQPGPGRRINANVRNIMEVITSRYGADEDWGKTKTYIYQASGRLALQQVKEVIDFLDGRVSKKAARNLLQTSPRVLRKPVDSFLRPTADFLLDLWGPSLFEEAMNRNPQVLLSSGVGYTNKHRSSTTGGDIEIQQLLADVAGLSSTSFSQLQRSAPFVFGLPSTKVKSVLAYLSNILEHGTLPPDGIPKVLGKIVVAHPNLLNLGVETNLRRRVEFLSSSAGLNVTDVAKMIQSCGGSVLGLSVDHNLKPTMQFLSVLLQHDRSALRKCILAHPQLLGLSLTNLQSKVDYFDSIGKSVASRIAFRCPAIYSLSLETNLIPTIDFLAKVWGTPKFEESVDISESVSLAHFLQEYPNILSLSLVGNIQPTLNFFNRTGYTLLSSDWDLVEGNTRIRGRYIAASLYNRLLPRWHYCMSLELKTPPLHLLVSASDVVFCKDQSLDLDEFVTFRDEAIPRLKFSSQFDTWLKTGRPIDI